MSSRIRAVVMGLGPAGRIAAHRAAARGWDVMALDPAGGSMPSTVGAWAHQLPGWLPADAVASRFRPTVITSEGRRRVLDDAYVVFDTARLSDLGGFRVLREPGLGGGRVTFMAWSDAPEEKVSPVARVKEALGRLRELVTTDPGQGPSVSIHHEHYDSPEEEIPDDFVDPNGPGGEFEEWTSPDILVDAVGAGPDAAVLEARQLACGHVFREADLPDPVRVPVLMDFTVPEAYVDGDFPATFSYRVPLGDGTWLIEETILAARASSDADDPRRADLHAHLRRMQAHRLSGLGVDPASAISGEVVDFPMGPWRVPDNRPLTPLNEALEMVPIPGRPTSCLDLSFLARPFGGGGTPGYGHFGACGGWMHPATGYSVGSVLSDVDRFLDRLEARTDASPPGGRPLAWLRRRGLHVLLGFDSGQTREFFDSFLSLPEAAIREYLTGTSTPRTLAVMVALAIPLGRRNPKTLARLLSVFADGKAVDL
ncbi:lycopene cyclase family protein [Corynebacterium sp. NPDC060344]|uniref:lycopene cyclase family protein n=1 Tax=Corynebacterium sp. NPDC060344 TaxID=3347101 RepID=UPI00365D7484